MKTAFQIIIGLCTLSTIACTNKGGDAGPPPPPPPVAQTGPVVQVPPPNTGYDPNMMMSYVYIGENACTTGTHSVKYSEYCALLQDEAQNQSCAADQRKLAYNKNCVTGSNPTSGVPGQFLMPSGAAAYCTLTGVDENKKSKTNSYGNDGSLSAQTFVYWAGAGEQNFTLSNLSTQFTSYFGRVDLSLSPASVGTGVGATGKLSVLQKGGTRYTAVSKFSSRLTVEVTNFAYNRKVIVDCIPNSTLMQGQADLTRVTCQVGKGLPQEILWNSQAASTTELKSREGRNLKLELLPAANGVEETMQISVEQLDGDNDVLAKAAVRSGLQVNYRSRDTGTQMTVQCTAASK